MDALTPKQIVAELDRYIVGQESAKRSVAIAIRNRWRRRQLDPDLLKEVKPKNILMIGPTGVGKTEIARRIAQLVGAPFCKVEATKYTEVGYHGRDVDSMVRDLTEAAFRLVKEQQRCQVQADAEKKVESRLVDLLLPIAKELDENDPMSAELSGMEGKLAGRQKKAKARMAEKLQAGELEEKIVKLKSEHRGLPIQVLSNVGMEQMDVELQQMFDKMLPKAPKERELTVREARKALLEEEIDKLIDRDQTAERAVELAEQTGIIFIDEFDKICGSGAAHGPDVSRQGVQRDLLPVVEGTSVQTRYGTVHTEHMLFIAAGAFSQSKPSDLLPELQGRFPIRVELLSLNETDFLRILQEPENSLIRQYSALLQTEGLLVRFTDAALQAIAQSAHRVNQKVQNIGARRLHTIMEKLLEDASFNADERSGEELVIDAGAVHQTLSGLITDDKSSQYIL